MFRAVSCSSSGGQIVLLQPLVSSQYAVQSALNRHTVRPFTESDDTRGCNNKICPPEDEQNTARNMLRIIIYYYWYSALGSVWAETKVQSGDWYGSDTLHPGQVLRGSFPLLSPAF